jgi:hypothetical protein
MDVHKRKKSKTKRKKQTGGSAKSRAFQAASNTYRAYSKKVEGKKNVRQLYDGEIHYGLHGYTGPGTRIDIPSVRNGTPFNNIDACSKTHDIVYEKIFQMPLGRARQEAMRNADI